MMLSQRIDSEIVITEVCTQVDNNYDVIAVGLGTAGALAVITAGKLGLSVLGIERTNSFGGTGTVCGILPYYFGSKGGEFERIDAQVEEIQKLGYTNTYGQNPEVKKYIMEQESLKYGVDVSLNSVVTGALIDGNRVLGVQWFENGELKLAKAKVVIDCTGEAEVCSLVGCQTNFGRVTDNRVQPYSNVQLELFEGNNEGYRATDCGVFCQSNAQEYSDAHIFSATLPTYFPDSYHQKRQLLGFMPLMGIREGRLIIGEESVTFEDYLEDHLSDQPLFYAYSNVDSHGKDLAFESEQLQDWIVAANLWGVNISVPIPLGALIPKGYEGLLVAGRCLAVDHDIAPCVRMKRDMQKCGEAAANVAYLAIKNNTLLKEISYKELRKMLLQTNCLDERNNVGKIDIKQEANKTFDWIVDENEILEGLRSNQPGIAIWSAKRMKLTGKLIEWIHSEDSNLSKNSAFALALLGNSEANPVLRDIVAERDDFVPETSRNYNHVRWHSAIYLLGRLKDAGSIGLLEDILRNTIENKNSIVNGLISTDRDYSFQAQSQAVMALLKIGKAHTEYTARINNIFENHVFSEDFDLELTMIGGGNVPYNMTGIIKEVLGK